MNLLSYFAVLRFAIMHCLGVNLRHVTVTELLLVENDIAEIREHSLSRYTLLIHLELEDNRISFIHDMAFKHTNHLQMLNLNRNLVTPGLWLEALFFSLSCLHMRGHQVNGWHELSLLQFNNITKLQLSNNDMGPLMNGTFLPTTLRSLKLKLSRIEKMTNMSHLEHIGTLHIHRNKLTSLPDLSHLPLQDDGLMIERENCITLNPLLLNCSVRTWNTVYRKISNIRRTKSQNLIDSHLVLKSPLPNPLKPGVKSRTKM